MTTATIETLLASVLLDLEEAVEVRAEMLGAVLVEVSKSTAGVALVLRLATSDSPAFLPTGPGIREALHRARYMVNALGRSRDGGLHPQEAQFFRQHKEARAGREAAERFASTLAQQFGNVLGHYGISDEATTPDCEFLIGKNYRVDDPPDGLYPGARHAQCRCTSGPPILNAEVV